MLVIVGKGRRVAFVLVAETEFVVDAGDEVSPGGEAPVDDEAVGTGENENSVVDEMPSVGETENFGVEDTPLVGGVAVASPACEVEDAVTVDVVDVEEDEICSGVASHVSDPINLPCIQHCQAACCRSGTTSSPLSSMGI